MNLYLICVPAYLDIQQIHERVKLTWEHWGSPFPGIWLVMDEGDLNHVNAVVVTHVVGTQDKFLLSCLNPVPHQIMMAGTLDDHAWSWLQSAQDRIMSAISNAPGEEE